MPAHYEIVEKIGAVGMGEAYGATDTKLGRDVASKPFERRSVKIGCAVEIVAVTAAESAAGGARNV